MKRRYVTHGPKCPVILPKDVWQGGTFIEADGTICEVIYSGRHMPATDIQRRVGSRRTIGHPTVRTA